MLVLTGTIAIGGAGTAVFQRVGFRDLIDPVLDSNSHPGAGVGCPAGTLTAAGPSGLGKLPLPANAR